MKAWGIEARDLVRRLEIEEYTKARIAFLGGWAHPRPCVVTFRKGQGVHFVTLERLRKVARLAFLEG